MKIYTEHTPERICNRYRGRIDDFSLLEKEAKLAALSELCGGFKSWSYGVMKSSLSYTLRRLKDENARIQYEEQGQGTLGYGTVFDHIFLFRNQQGDLFLTAFPYTEPSTIVSTVEELKVRLQLPELELVFLGEEFNFISRYNEGFMIFVKNRRTSRLPICRSGV